MNLTKMRCKFYKAIRKHYALVNGITNGMIALGMAGLAVLGVITPMLTTFAVLGWGSFLGATYFMGKFLDQQIEDMDKVDTCEGEDE